MRATRHTLPKAARPSARPAAETLQPRGGTADKLVQAATAEFNEHGYDGTDTNKIARRAGFAPQTFYRWFADKADIFIRVYEHWQQLEMAMIGKLIAENASDARLVQASVAHHRAFLVFRRSLRQLSVENDAVRAARAQSRLSQIAYIRGWAADAARDTAELAAILLQLERLADALAEGELRDMGLDGSAAEAALVDLIRRLRAPATTN